jgi:hypothetical protein
MTDVKTWTQSVTVRGAIIAAVGAVLQKFHFDAPTELLTQLLDWATTLITLIGAGMALVGRLKATKRIVPASVVPSTLLCLVLLPALLGAGGCHGQLVSPDQAYVAADRATFEAVAPEYRQYVAADALLGPEQKARRDRTLATWELRIVEGERANAPATVPPDSTTP